MQDLQVDAHQPVSDHRKARCTGTALQVAAGLVDTGMATGACTARLMLFVGGPCTEGTQSSHAERSIPDAHSFGSSNVLFMLHRKSSYGEQGTDQRDSISQGP